MAYDLLFKHNPHNWSRDLDDVAPIQDSPKRAAAVDLKAQAQTAKLAPGTPSITRNCAPSFS